MVIVNRDSREVLVENCKASEDNLFLSIEHALLRNDTEAQPISFLKVPESHKKTLLSKDWYWDGAKLSIEK